MSKFPNMQVQDRNSSHRYDTCTAHGASRESVGETVEETTKDVSLFRASKLCLSKTFRRICVLIPRSIDCTARAIVVSSWRDGGLDEEHTRRGTGWHALCGAGPLREVSEQEAQEAPSRLHRRRRILHGDSDGGGQYLPQQH